jgi:hypothetical protein
MRKQRKVKNVKSAELLSGRPPFIGHPGMAEKLDSAQKAGLAYERKVARYLQDLLGEDRVLHGPWFKYVDHYGNGWCSPDIIILPDEGDLLVVGECKLSWQKNAEGKLKNLYVPAASFIWPNNRYIGIQITKNLKKESKLMKPRSRKFFIRDILEAYDIKTGANGKAYALWNWR